MNPDLIDGLVNRDQWNGNNARLALRPEAILKRLVPEKIVYHHSSGNLGSMPAVPKIKKVKKIALWDPVGETSKMITDLGIKFHKVEPCADLSGFELHIISKGGLYTGEKTGKTYLEKAGFNVIDYTGGALTSDQVLIAGPGSGEVLSANGDNIRNWLKTGGHLMAIGLTDDEINKLLPDVHMKTGEHIASFFEPLGVKSLLAGIGPSDVHNRAPKEFQLISSGAVIIGNGVLAKIEEANVIFCQLVPWHLDYSNGSTM